jgi:hypothetical protein
MVNNPMRLLDIFNNDFLLEDLEGQKASRGQFIKDKYGKDFRGIPGYPRDKLDQLIDKIGEVDPSTKGIYMPWIARLVISKPQENRAEDLDRVGEDLRNFETHKRQIARKDINQYRSFQDLYDVTAPFMSPRELTPDELEREEERQKDEEMRDQITVVYRGPEGWIKIPETYEAAKWLGRNTRWCTSMLQQYKYYTKDDKLFIVYNKANKQRYQLHINSGQFAQEDDRNIGTANVPEWAKPKILDWYDKNVGRDKLTWKQVMTLSTFGDENLAKGTPHEDLVALMKAYGV